MKGLGIYIMAVFVSYTPESLIKFFSTMNDNKLVLLVLSPFLAILMTYTSAIYTLFTFILVDLYTGISKDLHQKNIHLSLFKRNTWVNWKAVTSSGFRKSWTKVREYVLGTLLIHLLEVNVLGFTQIALNENTSVSLTLMFIMVLAGTEVWSIFENLEAVSGRNKLKSLLTFLPEKIKEIFNK